MERVVNPSFDKHPTVHHCFNFKISRRYIRKKTVLDIGCWTGQFESLAVHTMKKTKIIGVDPSLQAIQYAKEKIPSATFTVASALELPFKDHIFDAVLLFEVLEHLPKGTESIALAEMKRVLKPRGYLILSTPSSHFLSIALDPAFFLIGHRHYSLTQLENLLRDHLFIIKKVYRTGGIVFLFMSLWETICKHTLGKKLPTPRFIDKKINQEYVRGGFATLHLVCQNV